jgi:hypothetical protein
VTFDRDAGGRILGARIVVDPKSNGHPVPAAVAP